MQRYAYHASAVGLGGVLSSGNARTVIPSQASVALAPTGGEGSAVVENYNQHGVSFSRAECRVVGTEVGDGVFTTYADVFITNLTVFGRLRIALMAATVTSTRSLEAGESNFDVRLMYRGVTVGNDEIVPVLDVDLCKAPTYGAVLNQLGADTEGYADSFGVDPAALRNALGSPDPQAAIGGTLVRGFQSPYGAAIAAQSRGAVVVPDVGIAHFGEFLFKPGRRRVNLLRMKLFDRSESTLEAGGDGGDLTGGSVEGNGTPPIP